MVEKFKSTKRPLENPEEEVEKAKKAKLAEDEAEQLAYLGDLTSQSVDNAKTAENEDIKPDIENRPPPVIMFSGFSEKFKTIVSYPENVVKHKYTRYFLNFH